MRDFAGSALERASARRFQHALDPESDARIDFGRVSKAARGRAALQSAVRETKR
jgi:hypothetical protein